MSPLRVEFRNGDLFLPKLNLWLDPHEPRLGPEKVFVSHAHSDHTAAHREVILSAPTAKLMRARVPGQRLEHTLNFGERVGFENGGAPFSLMLVPAGHIFGSAMALVETNGTRLLYTGDFKLRRGHSAEGCEPIPADILIMETTYGRPEYVFPATADVLKGVIRFCHEALDNDETPVLLGYSLGKSQELLCSLADENFPIMLHGTVFKLTQIYEQFGQCFPKYERYEAGSARGKVLLCPPHVVNSVMLRNLGKTRAAILTGWAVDQNCRFRYQCDAAFPLSDHADFRDLVELVKRVQPKMVYTLHGFAADFARTLRGLGYEAQALSQNEQLMLGIEDFKESVSLSSLNAQSATEHGGKLPVEPSSAIVQSDAGEAGSFLNFALVSSRIAADSRKLEKIRILAEYLRTLDADALILAVTWFTGRPFPANQNKVLQLGWAVLRDALCAVGRIDEFQLHQVYLKHSDSGETAKEVLENKRSASPLPQSSLSIQEIGEIFEKLRLARGPLAKTPVLRGALERCAPIEAKFLVKIISGDLRIGLKEGLVEDAVANAFNVKPEEVRQANLLVGDIAEVARLASANELSAATLVPFRPIKFMLASPEPTAESIWERVQEWHAAAKETAPPQVWIEDKYDGIRCQLHKVGQRVALYSRDLKDISGTFLELADAVRALSDDLIVDGEVVAMRGSEILPFAELQKRLGRREGDLFMRDEVPIKLVAFDLLWVNGKSLLSEPLRNRRQHLEALVTTSDCLRLATITRAQSVQEIEAAFTAARSRDNEGLMVKEPGSFYTPGRRGLAWLKLKKAFATLDCVVVGAEYGHGKRNKVLSDYTFAVRDDQSGELKTIGKAYSGLTDAEIANLTEHFLKHAIRQHGRYFEVDPDIILEIAFDRLQESDRHTSGLAMRFPRIVRIRTDKPLSEIDTVATARKLLTK
jgi:DNA ligase-1